MHTAMRSKLIAMPLAKLRKLRSDLDLLVRELENGPKREVDIAWDHTGVASLISKVLEVKQKDPGRRWQQLEKIYCSAERCQKCPHGPYLYEYRANRQRKTTAVRFRGALAFDYDVLQELKKNARPGKPYIIQTTNEGT
jgi:hypothetical protein